MIDFHSFKERFQKKPIVELENTVDDNPTVSVCVQTYNHRTFIAQCLDGLLEQHTSFPFEVLLGDDDSSDGTREICLDYARRYPNKIRMFLHDRINNIEINGVPSGRFNFSYNLYSAKGKFIAICEGDDYWTDPDKLQKQVDYLNEHPEHSICFHGISRVDEKGQELGTHQIHQDTKVFNAFDMFEFNLPTLSVLFRKSHDVYPDLFFEVAHADIFFLAMHIVNGPFANLGFNGGSRRVHDNGFFSRIKGKERLRNIIQTRRLMLKSGFFSSQINTIIERNIRYKKKRHLRRVLRQGKIREFLSVYFSGF